MISWACIYFSQILKIFLNGDILSCNILLRTAWFFLDMQTSFICIQIFEAQLKLIWSLYYALHASQPSLVTFLTESINPTI